jgi:TetR/AcrR family transcriptional repressor of nem operon
MMRIIYRMPRSAAHKAASHDRIVDVAASRIREAGLDAPGVAAIMREAGLTHGGFYKHFTSREDLVAEAAQRAFAQSEQRVAELVEDADDPLVAFVDFYLSPEHRDDPGSGCAVVALGADASRADDRVRAAYTEQVQRYTAHLEQLLEGAKDARREAVASVAAMVGALLLARAVNDDRLSREILRDVADAVKRKR